MYTALPNNLQILPSLSSENQRIEVATFEKEATFVIETRSQSQSLHTTSQSRATEVELSSDLKLESIATRDKGIQITSVDGEGLSGSAI